MSDWKHQFSMRIPDFDEEWEEIRLSVSKNNQLYITVVDSEPVDKYGSDFVKNSACMFMSKETGSKLMIALAKALNAMEWNDM